MYLQKFIFVCGLLLALCVSSATAQQLNLEKISENCMGAIVSIVTPGGHGSGFVINEKGYIFTNYHVISVEDYQGNSYARSSENINISFQNKKEYRCSGVLYTDAERDIAIIKIEPNSNHKIIALPLSEKNPSQGIEVAAIGHPNGVKFSINKGSISNLSPSKTADFIIQTDVAVNPGNSGGPLLNANGAVVGMIFSRFERQSIFDRDVQGMNFAIHVKDLKIALKSRGIPFKEGVLINDADLAGRKLSPEEEKAAQELALQQIELEKIKKVDEAEKARLEREKETEIIQMQAEVEKQRLAEKARTEQEKAKLEQEKNATIIKLSTEQELRLQAQNFEFQQQRNIAQQKLELQRIEELKQREMMQLEQDKLNLAAAKDKQKANHQAFYQQQPPHIGFKFGGGAFYEGGTLLSDFNLYDASRTTPFLQAAFGYRLDLEDKKLGYRGSMIGIFGRMHILTNQNLNNFLNEQNLSSFTNLSDINLGSDIEIGGIWREWLRASIGRGQQKINHNGNQTILAYNSATVSFIGRIAKSVEIELYINSIFGRDLNQPMFRGGLSLNFFLAMGKW